MVEAERGAMVERFPRFASPYARASVMVWPCGFTIFVNIACNLILAGANIGHGA